MLHWSEHKEAAGGVWQMKLVFDLYRSLGPSRVQLFLHVIVIFFFLFSPAARRISRAFLEAVSASKGQGRVRSRQVYRHFYCFSYALLEKLSAWTRDIQVKDLVRKGPDLEILVKQLEERHGAVVLCSHLGNTEILRAMASLEAGKTLPPFGINSIVDFSGTSKFNKLMEKINPESMVRLYSASAIGPETIIELSNRLESGDLVIIAADRTAAKNRSKSGKVRFLGQDAYFPLGAFVMASLLDAPIYHMFAVRQDDLDFKSPYELYIFKSGFDFAGSRKERMKKVLELMEEYSGHLEKLCISHPYQWFNFFDFWKTPRSQIMASGNT